MMHAHTRIYTYIRRPPNCAVRRYSITVRRRSTRDELNGEVLIRSLYISCPLRHSYSYIYTHTHTQTKRRNQLQQPLIVVFFYRDSCNEGD